VKNGRRVKKSLKGGEGKKKIREEKIEVEMRGMAEKN
jgi:hypothetical protein